MMRRIGIGVLVLLALVGCEDKKKHAEAIYQKARALEQEQKILQAYLMYDSLAAFEGTEPYELAKAELLKRGISIGSCLSSWTVIEMVELQNLLKDHYNIYKQNAPSTQYASYFDAWGHPIQVKWFPKDKVVFTLFSAGADEKEDTDDDIILGYREQYQFEIEEQAAAAEKGQARGGDQLVDLKALNDTSNSQNMEIQTTLEALQKTDHQKQSEEKVVDLNSLLKKNN